MRQNRQDEKRNPHNQKFYGYLWSLYILNSNFCSPQIEIILTFWKALLRQICLPWWRLKEKKTKKIKKMKKKKKPNKKDVWNIMRFQFLLTIESRISNIELGKQHSALRLYFPLLRRFSHSLCVRHSIFPLRPPALPVEEKQQNQWRKPEKKEQESSNELQRH